ncbi:hypothetical protein ABG067_006660 [Albugo candida]|uniref:Uncharacterized protein n=1 Tax=Albugo candida TaxID=65357 RepID=A0A024GD21_9STRA|nr:unnamed protein product [Albugo candida]|eukprot:CCI44672.1 unnamed protein product [Albugo candida]
MELKIPPALGRNSVKLTFTKELVPPSLQVRDNPAKPIDTTTSVSISLNRGRVCVWHRNALILGRQALDNLEFAIIKEDTESTSPPQLIISSTPYQNPKKIPANSIG